MAAKSHKKKVKKGFHIYDVAEYLDGKKPERYVISEMSDGEIYLIGEITVLWAYLEHALLLETARLVNRAKWTQLPSDAESLSFSRRLSAWRETYLAVIKTPRIIKRLERLHKKIASIETTRHKITHGLWHWFPSNPDRLMVSSFRPRVSFIERKITFQRLVKIVEQIGEAAYELSNPPPQNAEQRKKRNASKQLAAFKEHGFSYVSRRLLLEFAGRHHANLGPLSSMPQARTPPQPASRGSFLQE